MAHSLDSVTFRGSGLRRPECVLCHSSGLVFASDWTDAGGVSVLHPGGAVSRVLASDRASPLRPNGIALEPGGSFLLAHLGDGEGGVWRLFPDGTTEPVLLEVGGVPLPPTNFVHLDPDGRIWITVSTRRQPRALGYRPDVADGFVVLVDRAGARIVADGLGYTNECLVDPAGTRLYVNETFARRLTSFAIEPDGSLTDRQEIARFGPGTFPDGLTFDAQGGVWITSIVSNRVVRIDVDGSQTVYLEDNEPEHLDLVERAFQAGEMGRPHLDQVRARRLNSISSLAFGGADLKTGFLGCLLGGAIAVIDMPVAGHPPTHWSYDLGPLAGIV